MSLTAAPEASLGRRVRRGQPGERTHRILLALAIGAVAALVLFLCAIGRHYYPLGLEERPFSPLHSRLRSSGSIGLKLGILSVGMFAALFLYPLRKRWRWLGTIGSTRRWLNFHVLLGIATPVVVTFHTTFKWHGIAGLAYWTMMAVALSGFVGRYVYAKIPRGVHAVELTVAELESQTAGLADRLREQHLLAAADLEPLLGIPGVQAVRAMGFVRTLATMLVLDLARPFRVARLRRCLLSRPQRFATLGGLIASRNPAVENLIDNLRRQSRLLAARAFLDRTARVFYWWHVIHRPFSITFAALVAVHIAVALSVGF